MLLPFHPQPQAGEILSSWMVRLSYANGFKLHTFYSSLLGYKGSIWNRDIDRQPAPKLLELLSRYTAQDISALQAMTLSAYTGELFECLPVGNVHWVLPVGVYHRSRRRPGVQYCPICLRSSAQPYYRRFWRLALYVVCAVHQCILNDRCPCCSLPIAFHRSGIGKTNAPRFDAMHACHVCGFDFRLTPASFMEDVDPDAFALLLRLNSADRLEGWDVGETASPCPLPFYEGLRVLVNLVFGRYGQALRDAIDAELKIPGYSQVRLGAGYELLDISNRLRIMFVLSWLLAEWPERFIRVSFGRLPAPSQARVDRGPLAFWLQKVFDPVLMDLLRINNVQR